MTENNFKLELVSNDKKKCIECNKLKILSEFSSQKKGNLCRECYRKFKKEYYSKPHVKKKEREHFLKRYFKRKYGITYNQYQEMFLKQNGCCAICKSDEKRTDYRSNKKHMLHVDHCHKTGKIRGLLCSRCNLSLGKFEDNILLLEACIKYLQQ